MSDASADVSIRRQCELLGVSKSGVYCECVSTSREELVLMRRIDELHLKLPFYGSRKMTVTLQAEGGSGQSRACAAVDASDGVGGAGSEAEYEQAGAGASGLSLPAASPGD